MGNIFSLDKIGTFFRSYLRKTSSKTQGIVADNIVVLAERTSEKGAQKVTSPQVEAYYKRYNKCTRPIQKTNVIKNKPATALTIDNNIEAEVNAYNRARFLEVSQDALNGLKQDFEQKRDKVKEIILKDSDKLPPEFVKGVKSIKTPEELALIIRAYVGTAESHLDERYNEIIQRFLKTKVIPLKDQQKLHKEEMHVCSTYVEIIKAVTEPTKDANTLAIEDYLKSRYGMEYVHLGDINEAKRVLKAVTLAQKHQLPMPKNIIISPYTPMQTSAVNCPHSAQEFTIVLRSTKEDNAMRELAYSKLKNPQLQDLIKNLHEEDRIWYSTNDELHRYIHEFRHGSQFVELLLPQKWNPIPKKYEGTINNLGIYARTSRKEVDAELKTKEILGSLKEDEKELLDYLEQS